MAGLIKAFPITGETVLPHVAIGMDKSAQRPQGSSGEVEPQLVKATKVAPPPADPSTKPVVDAKTRVTQSPVSAAPVEESPEAVSARVAKQNREALIALELEAKDRGFKQGLDEGVNEGQRRSQAELASAIEALRAALQSVESRADEVLVAAEELVGTIVFEAVCKLVGGQLMTAEGVRSVVANVVAKTRREEILAIKVSESDYALLTADAEASPGLAGLRIEPDGDIELGGAIVELKGGRIDGRIETQFRQFAQMIRDAAARRGGVL